MATLADSFLQDLDDLEDDDSLDLPPDGDDGAPAEAVTEGALPVMSIPDLDQPIIDAVEVYFKAKEESAPVVSGLMRKTEFAETLQLVRDLVLVPAAAAPGNADEMQKAGEGSPSGDCSAPSTSLTEEEECELIEKCNKLVIQVDTEIMNVHRFIRDVYSKKLPELEQIVYTPLEYITIVKRLKNETDLTQIDLTDLLPNTVIMAVTVAASMTTGAPLPSQELEQVVGAADEALQLAQCRKEILQYLETRMSLWAPNLTNLLGSALAARILTKAEGLVSLARMPAQNIMLIGGQRRPGGFGASRSSSSSASIAVPSLLCNSEILQSVPPAIRGRALKLLAGKTAIAARVDSFHAEPLGNVGAELRAHIVKALIKAQEPPPAPQRKALPAPDDRPKPRRGGRRYRRLKEKFQTSDIRKAANRMKFGADEEQEIGLAFGKGLGMLNRATGKGKLKMQVKASKVQMPKRRALQLKASAASLSGTITAGTASSLAFTPIQGIELCNPDAARAIQQEAPGGTTSYFASTAKFTKVESQIAASMIPKKV
eukprot:GHVT01064635.1.p1 GENE.GHVT01064635.1~~GHVT01064635.1.p1  ORF type:complete len:543 (-),score=157.76 GHVT01064635.1:867-2495(-)